MQAILQSALIQYGADTAEHIVCYQQRQLQAAERNNLVYDTKLLAMKDAQDKIRVNLLEVRPFIVYPDYALLHASINRRFLQQCMAKWLSFYAEYDFSVKYKSGRLKRRTLTSAQLRADSAVRQ